MKHLRQLPILGVSVLSLFLYSCSSTEFASHIQKRNMTKAKPATKFVHAEPMKTMEAQLSEAVENVAASAEIIEVSRESNTVMSKPQVQQKLKAEKASAVSYVSVKEQRVEAKKEVRKAVKEFRKEQKLRRADSFSADDTLLLLLIIGIILPPLGVYLFDGEIGTPFWISLILTLLFWFPGSIYAVLHILGAI